MSERTIAAISTPLGDGGIGVIRISGENAFAVADKIFKSVSGKRAATQKGYSALFGDIVDGDVRVDEAVVTVFRAPKSYTGENVAEISVHGGRLILKKVLRLVLENGAVAAGPGEFTRRAFLNGKLDLTQAESIMGLISAQSDTALKFSQNAYSGHVSREIADIKALLLEVAASVAVYADYPDEDLDELKPEVFKEKLQQVITKLRRLIKNYDAGKVVREGIDTAIVGKPNVGKSTLMNLLSGVTRSIVTDIAGTTRDVIEETVTVGDITLRLADTAGIRNTADTVEAAGVDLAKERLQSAALILAVFDLSAPLDKDDFDLIEQIKNKRTLIVLNKSDKAVLADLSAFENLKTVTISAKTGDGEEQLFRAIAEITEVSRLSPDTGVLTSERQRDCAVRALSAAEAALLDLTSGQTVDMVGILIDDAVTALLELTGERATNEVTDEVFRRFCVGK